MDTRALLVRYCLVAEDAYRVLFRLDLQIVLADAGQFYDRNEVIAFLEDVDWWIAANPAVLSPIQSLSRRASSALWSANNASNGSP
jgi:hypothetical protein